MAKIRGIRVVQRKFRAPAYHVTLSVTGYGAAYLGRAEDLGEAKCLYDAAKVLFFHLTGQRDKLSIAEWFNEPGYATTLTREAAEAKLGPELTEVLRRKAEVWLSRNSGAESEPVLTTKELTQRLAELEQQVHTLAAQLDSFLNHKPQKEGDSTL